MESEFHARAKMIIAYTLLIRGFRVVVERDLGWVKPDVFASSERGSIAVEVYASDVTWKNVLTRIERYSENDIYTLIVLSPRLIGRRMHLSRVPELHANPTLWFVLAKLFSGYLFSVDIDKEEIVVYIVDEVYCRVREEICFFRGDEVRLRPEETIVLLRETKVFEKPLKIALLLPREMYPEAFTKLPS